VEEKWLIEPMVEIMTELQSLSSWTWSHLSRVAQYAVAFGKKLGLDNESLVALQCAAILHDVGKLIVPAEVLNKKTPLTRDEWFTITKHPMASSKLLKAQDLPTRVTGVAQSHHEWYNGKGYPLGLQGQAIPLCARILSIADAYDAMSTDRPYRAALKPDEIVREFERGAGEQFDPNLVHQLKPLFEHGVDDLITRHRMRVISDDPMLYQQLWFAGNPHGWEIEPYPQQWEIHCPADIIAPKHADAAGKVELTVVDGRCLRRLPHGTLERVRGPILWVDPVEEDREPALYRPLDIQSLLVHLDSQQDRDLIAMKVAPTKVIIADPHHLFRQVLRRCLDEREDMQVVAEADSPSEYRKVLKGMQFDVSIVASDLLTGTRSTAPLRAGDYLLDEDETTEGPQGKKPTIVLVADEDLEEANPGECWESGEGGSKRVYIHRGAPVEVLVSALHRLAGKVGA
jgi:hypothetical protein